MPNLSEKRILYIKENDKLLKCDMKDLTKGDKFLIFEPSEEPARLEQVVNTDTEDGSWEATGEPYKVKDAWCIQAK